MKHLSMAMCKATNRTVIRDYRYEKWEEPLRMGGGGKGRGSEKD
jgi:hypothetical protein